MTHRMLILGQLVLLAAMAIDPVQAADAPANDSVAAATDKTSQSSELQQKLAKLGYEQGNAVQQIQNYRVDSWNYIDDKHIMIYAGPSVRYLISTLISCPDLGMAETIGFSTTASNLTKFDKLVVRGAGGMRRDCPIDALHQLNSRNK